VGLKDWLIKNVAGVSAYGEVMGRESVKNGIAFGRVLYVSHGTCSESSQRFIFNDAEEMESNGFTPYCQDPLNRPSMEDRSQLSMGARALGMAFAVQLCLTASSNFMRNDANRRDFHHALGSGNKGELAALSGQPTMEQVLRFFNLPPNAEVSQVLNTKQPGTDDLLGTYLRELSKQEGAGRTAFQREGVLGFDLVASPLAQETVVKIREACGKFGW
jgi:hypothetical protein